MTDYKKRKIKQIVPFVLMLVTSALWTLTFGGLVSAEGTPYTDSAHGNTSYGVNRSSMSVEDAAGHGYARGNCAHCHEQHASVGGAEPDPDNGDPDVYLCFRSPFGSQSVGFCMKCHKGQDSVQYGGYITNYDYSQRRGEESKSCPTDVKTNFRFLHYNTRLPRKNCDLTEAIGSAHDLLNIRNDALQGYWGWGSNRSVINPCLGCHNVHRATRDFPCALPSGHNNKLTWEIWGDESGEKMADYIGGRIYQPPFQANGASYERDAYSQPDYNTLCLECHGREGGLASEQHGTVVKIEWGSAVSHGRGSPVYLNNGPIRAPYEHSKVGNYILCCTDCHEPHGSRNEWLLRTEVNGVDGIEVNQPLEWFQLCNACHDMHPNHLGEGDVCGGVTCHGHGADYF